MGQLVNIPGVGQVNFPDGMDDVAITKAIRTQIMPRYAQEGGGVTDAGPTAPQAPPRGDIINPVNMPHDEAAAYATTRIRNAATGIAGIPRMASDLVHSGGTALGLSPADVQNALKFTNLPAQAAPALPSSQEMNRGIEKTTGIQPVNGNPVIDAAIEAGLSGPMLGGGIGSVIPSAASGLTSEAAGRVTQGTPYEIPARLAGGVAGGLAGVGVQNAGQNAARLAQNVLPNVDEAAGRIISKNALRDKTTVDAIDANRPEGGMFVEGAGPNVQGALRGSVAGQGEGRTNALQNMSGRVEGSDTRTVNALNKGISPNDSLPSTVDDLAALRSQQATPAYEAAGIPRKPESRITAMDEPPTWNTKQVTSPALEQLVADSPDIRSAREYLRRFPDYKNIPENSMSMWDEGYKVLGGWEQEAVRAGNNRKSMLIGDLRRDYQTALVDANPEYGRALKAYAGPSKLIDAGATGREWFTKNAAPDMVAREFQMMTPDQQQAALIGVRDWARTNIGSPGPSLAANKVKLSGDNLARMQAILPPEAFQTLVSELGIEKNLGATMNRTGLNSGSRTTPMALEAADNAGMAGGVMGDLAHGRPFSAAGRMVGNAFSRLTEGRTEAVNARIADLLTSTDPAKVGMVRALAARAELERIVGQQGRSNALRYGVGSGVAAPLRAPSNALNNGQRQ